MYIFILLLILSYECEFDRHYSLSFGYECSTFSSVHLSFICHKRTCQHKWGEYSERINDFVCTKPYSLQSSLRFCHLIRLRFSLIVCLVITGLRWKQKTRKCMTNARNCSYSYLSALVIKSEVIILKWSSSSVYIHPL